MGEGDEVSQLLLTLISVLLFVITGLIAFGGKVVLSKLDKTISTVSWLVRRHYSIHGEEPNENTD